MLLCRSEVEAAAQAKGQKDPQQGNRGLWRNPLQNISNTTAGSATAIPSAVDGQAPTAAKPTAPRRVPAAPRRARRVAAPSTVSVYDSTFSVYDSLPDSLLHLTVEEVIRRVESGQLPKKGRGGSSGEKMKPCWFCSRGCMNWKGLCKNHDPEWKCSGPKCTRQALSKGGFCKSCGSDEEWECSDPNCHNQALNKGGLCRGCDKEWGCADPKCTKRAISLGGFCKSCGCDEEWTCSAPNCNNQALSKGGICHGCDEKWLCNVCQDKQARTMGGLCKICDGEWGCLDPDCTIQAAKKGGFCRGCDKEWECSDPKCTRQALSKGGICRGCDEEWKCADPKCTRQALSLGGFCKSCDCDEEWTCSAPNCNNQALNKGGLCRGCDKEWECADPKCTKRAISLGGFCKSCGCHEEWTCSAPNCNNQALSKGGLCRGCDEEWTCSAPNCNNQARNRGGFCRDCDEKWQCSSESCLRQALIKNGKCKACDPAWRCREPGCVQVAVSKVEGLCVHCGGGVRCHLLDAHIVDDIVPPAPRYKLPQPDGNEIPICYWCAKSKLHGTKYPRNLSKKLKSARRENLATCELERLLPDLEHLVVEPRRCDRTIPGGCSGRKPDLYYKFVRGQCLMIEWDENQHDDRDNNREKNRVHDLWGDMLAVGCTRAKLYRLNVDKYTDKNGRKVASMFDQHRDKDGDIYYMAAESGEFRNRMDEIKEIIEKDLEIIMTEEGFPFDGIDEQFLYYDRDRVERRRHKREPQT